MTTHVTYYVPYLLCSQPTYIAQLYAALFYTYTININA